jgi:ATP/maltotriose-dependent transcriptional regulator MalT
MRVLVHRPRLLAVLAGRFERRVTVVTAGAGFGKTSLLLQATEDNELDPAGIDVWLQCMPADVSAVELGQGLLASLGAPLRLGVEAIVEAVWARAPDEVVLVLDDAHHLVPESPGWAVLGRLVEELPTNGHLLLASRAPLELPLGRWRAAGQVAELTEADLVFDDGELAAFTGDRHVAVGQLADIRWPAVAELAAEAGRGAASGYLWQEVLSGLDPARLDALTRVAPFAAVDAELLAAVTDGALELEELVAGLPLVERTGSAFRLHGLWTSALAGRLPDEERRAVLVAGGELLLDRGDSRAAFEAFREAGHLPGVHRAVRHAVARPLIATRLDDLHVLLDRLPPEPSLALDRALLEAFLRLADAEEQAMMRFAEVATHARAKGDGEAEAVALWRLYHSDLWAGARERVDEIAARLAELAAAGVPLAGALSAVHDAICLGYAGDVTGALAALRAVSGLGTTALAQTSDLRAGVLMDLGRPEEVLPLSADPAATLDIGTDQVIRLVEAHAVWLRGDVSPEDGLRIAESLLVMVGMTRISHQLTATLGVITVIAAHAGALDRASVHLRRARQHVDHSLGGHAAAMVLVAEADLAACEGDEVRAGELVAEALRLAPLERIPSRSHYNSLALVYLLAPDHRAILDSAPVGPSVMAAAAAGRALVALREQGDPSLAAALPWDRPTLLRVHVVPPHLAELACAALAVGVAEAANTLGALPRERELLRAVADRYGPSAVGFAARRRLPQIPAQPSAPLHLDLLGSVVLRRRGAVVDDELWSRARVRQILAYLADRGQTTRRELAAALWPELDEKAASGNLRTNLSHLQRVMEPERPKGEPPWYVRTSGEHITLCTEGLTVDVARFDALVEEARRHEGASLPGAALRCYQEAIAFYRGDYLAELDDTWCEYPRIRLRSTFVAAACRAGELLLARGEPEAALRLVDRATQVDELAERAHRLRIGCLLALGDRGAARAAGEAVLRTLADAGLAPDRDTARALGSVGLG